MVTLLTKVATATVQALAALVAKKLSWNHLTKKAEKQPGALHVVTLALLGCNQMWDFATDFSRSSQYKTEQRCFQQQANFSLWTDGRPDRQKRER